MVDDHDQTVVIIGAGLAGAKAAEALRTGGFDGRVLLIGGEQHAPYERPPLSKDYLTGTAERAKVFVHPDGWYADQAIELRLGITVTGIDRASRQVITGAGEALRYDKLLLATGACPRRLDLPGADAEVVTYLRTLEDSDRLRAAFTAGARVVIIGGGWIGLEAAAAARTADAQVTVLEGAPLPLLRVLGPAVAPVFADLHRAHGVDLRCGISIAGIQDRAGPGPATVSLADGTRLPADVVLVGVGATPNVALAAAAGLAIDNGIVVDQHLRTPDPDVYAIGDVANAYHPLLGRHIRVEHWANALHQPAVAAQGLIGRPASYDRLPYFYTDQFDLSMEYTGHAAPGGYDQVVIRGDILGREFIAFWLQAGRVLAGMNVNVWDVTTAIGDLIRAGRPVDTARLADPGVPLEELR
jgi:3-phenylpropionate/trans-cinnamate dioxygenase ferredoxin reductase subunit